MRKVIYAFCVIAFASIFVLSCSGDEFYDANSEENIELGTFDYAKGNQNLNIPSEYKVIGEKHNEGLEAAFMALRDHYGKALTRSIEEDTLYRLSKDECLLIAQQGLNAYCINNVSDNPKISEFPCAVGIKTRAQGGTLNSNVEMFVEKIKSVLLDEPDSPALLVKALNEINKEATAKLTEVDAIAVYAGTSTCYNSYMYWKENHMKWFVMLNCPESLSEFSDEELNHFILKNGKLVAPIQTRGDGWWDKAWGGLGEVWDSTKDYVSDWWSNGGGKDVVGTDAGDAVAGAMEGALIGSYVEGWGAVPGAIVVGIGEGAAGSISSAIQHWIAN